MVSGADFQALGRLIEDVLHGLALVYIPVMSEFVAHLPVLSLDQIKECISEFLRERSGHDCVYPYLRTECKAKSNKVRDEDASGGPSQLTIRPPS